MRIVLLTLLCSASLLAQSPLVELSLARDLHRRGPEAWTYVRDKIFAGLAEWPIDLDPFAAIHLEINSSLKLSIRGSDSSPANYLTANIHLPGSTRILATCNFDGLEGWRILQAGKLAARLDNLLTLLDLKFRRNLVSLDLGALTGNLMAGTICGDPLHSLLIEGAVECGVLQVGAFYETGRWRIAGQSEGGLLLPAAMVLLAEWQRHPPIDGDYFAARPFGEIDRWLLLASAGRHQVREEAARQLARFSGDQAHRGLERLLYSEGAVRRAAIVSLARRGATTSLEKALRQPSSGPAQHAALTRFALQRLEPVAAPGSNDPANLGSYAWARPGAWLLLSLSLLAISSKLLSSRRS